MKIGDNYTIHCYKHDGHIYNSYEHSILLDVKKDYNKLYLEILRSKLTIIYK